VTKEQGWIPFNSAVVTSDDIALAEQAIRDRHISGVGPLTRRAELLLTRMHGGGQSLLTTSCTHSLELAGRLLALKEGDEVIVPSFTFPSTANAFMFNGAKPVFCDIRPDTFNLDPEAVRSSLSSRTRAICVVHYGGVAANPHQFVELSSQFGVDLIEDNAHGLGAQYRGQVLGTFGRMSTLSFHETKNLTCGEGGAIHINDQSLCREAEIIREKGTNRQSFFRGEVDKYTWVSSGSSWVLSDILAGVLMGQLARFESIQNRRQQIWERYSEELASWGRAQSVRFQRIPEGCSHASHLFVLKMPTSESQHRILDHLQNNGINAIFHYQPLHTSPVGMRLGGRLGQCPVAEDVAETIVRLPLHLGLTDGDVEQVIDAVQTFQS